MNIDKRFQKDSGALLNIAIAYADKGDRKNAKQYFQSAIDADPGIAENYFSFGSYLLESIMKERVWRFGLLLEHIEELKEAERLLSKGIDLLKDSEKKGVLEDAYINRSSVRIILDDFTKAFEDINAAIVLNPDSAAAYANRARLNTLRKSPDDAIKDFICAIEKGINKDEIFPILVSCYLERPDPKVDEAIETIRKYYGGEAEKDLIPGVLMIECLSKKAAYDEAQKIVDNLYLKFGRNPRILLAEAELKRSQGNVKAFEELSLEARQNSVGLEKNIAEIELARHFKSMGAYDKAIPLYETFISESLFDDLLRDYLICLYKSKEHRSKNLEKCLTICQNLRKLGKYVPFTFELEAAIYEEMDRLDDAMSLYRELSKREPKNIRHKLNYAKVMIDIGREKDAGIRLLYEVKDEVEDKDSFLILARAFLKIQNHGEAIKQLFKALEIDFNNPEIQLFFIYTFTSRKDKKSEMLDSETVREDFFVKIKKNGHEQEYLITANPKSSIAKFELYKESGLGKALYGKRVAEEIIVKNEYGADDVIKIVEIKSKYVKAFQNILDNFNIFFPDNKAICKVEASPERLKDMLNKSSDRSTKIMEMYLSKNITIGALSAFSGRSLFVCWGALIDQGSKLYCATGSALEQRKEQETVLNSSKIIIEPIALFTLGFLNLLDLPLKMFSEVYVLKATLDELDMEIMELSKSKDDGLTTIFSREGKAFRQEISAENIKMKIDFIKKIRDSQDFKTIGLEHPLDDSFNGKEKILGLPYIYSIQSCIEKQIPLFCDDVFFRELIRNEHKIESFGIQNFLAVALQKGVLAENDYGDKILELMRIGYFYLSISAKMLFYYAEKDNFQIQSGNAFDMATVILDSKETSVESLFAVLTDFMKMILIETLPDEIKDRYLYLIIGLLAKRGSPQKIIKIFSQVLAKKLGLAEHLMHSVNKKIDQWIKLNYPIS